MSDSAQSPAEHRLVVDRLEGDLVVVEVDGGRVLDLPIWLLPPGVGEGDVLRARPRLGDGGEHRVEIRVDAAATRAARDDARERLDRLRARDPGGDIAL